MATDDIHALLPLGELVGPPAARQPADYEEWVIARRKGWRLVKTAVAAVVGAAIGWVLFAMVDSGLSRR